MDPDIDRLQIAIDAFVFPLRYREGFDAVAFGRLQEVIGIVTQRWGESESIPKIVAWQLCSLSIFVWRIADNYENAERERIQQASSSIAHMVDRCFLPSTEERLAYDRD